MPQEILRRGHAFRTMATDINASTANEKDAKTRLKALRLYRILQRSCGNLLPSTDGTIFLQNDLYASDWGNYQVLDDEDGRGAMAEDQATAELIRLFLVRSGADPVSGFSKLNDWHDGLVGAVPKNSETVAYQTACWTTPSRLREAVRFAFRSSSLVSSPSPTDLQGWTIRAIQMMQDQAKLWNQTSISVSSNGLVRVVATSKFLGSVSPVSVAASYSPLAPKYRFAYRIRIENVSPSTTVQLLGRYWRITEEHERGDNDDDDDDKRSLSSEPIEVDAPYTGAVGQLPVLQPGQGFEYVSGTDLATPKGLMKGHLYMATVPSQTISATSGDNVTAVACQGSSTENTTDEENSNDTNLFQAAVTPFRLESFEK